MSIKNKPLVVIFLTVFIDLVGFGIIIPLSPYLAKSFGATALEVGILMAIYSAAQFVFSPFWGGLSDKIGRRPVILTSLLGAAIAHLIFAFARNFEVLLLSRLLAGFFGANISTAMAYIADFTGESNRSKNMGLIGAAFGLGFVLGPALGAGFGHLGDLLGSTPPLGQSLAAIAASVVCFGNGVFAFFVLNESLSKEKRANSKNNKVSRFKKIFESLTLPVIGKLQWMYFLASFAMANMESTLFLYLKEDFGWSLLKAGLGFSYVGIIMVLTQGYFIRKLLPKWGERKVLFVGLILKFIGLFGLGFSTEVFHLAIAVTCLGFGTGFINPSLSGSISLLADEKTQGAVMGINQSLSALGRITGPLLGGWLYGQFFHSSPFYAASIIVMFSLFIGLSIMNKIPNSSKV